jgi:hydroxyacylglutathione hydrolase
MQEWRSRGAALERTNTVKPVDLHGARNKRVQIIDVRSPEEWRRGHIPGANHIPLAALPDRIGEIDSSLQVVLHCKGGGRSAIATSFLQARGVQSATNLEGGFERWVKEGYETVTDEPAKPKRRKTSRPTKTKRKRSRK